MAFDGRTDPDYGDEDKSPCTIMNSIILNMECCFKISNSTFCQRYKFIL